MQYLAFFTVSSHTEQPWKAFSPNGLDEATVAYLSGRQLRAIQRVTNPVLIENTTSTLCEYVGPIKNRSQGFSCSSIQIMHNQFARLFTLIHPVNILLHALLMRRGCTCRCLSHPLE
jgi:hypothetical protein